MHTDYNRIAGQSIERLAALSDGLFAVAMTLLVLDLHTPVAAAIHAERDLLHALLSLAPRLLAYLLSFLTLGIFWVGQQTHLNHFVRTDRNLAWINLGFLFAVSLMPFSTALIAGFPEYRTALLVYWLNLALLGAALFAALRYAMRAGLLRDDSAFQRRAIERRIIIAQALYAFGALLCVLSTWCSLGFIILVQLNYAIAPRIGFLHRL